MSNDSAIRRTIKHCCRHQDLAARLGGDEFTLLLRDSQVPLAGSLAGVRYRARIAYPSWPRSTMI